MMQIDSFHKRLKDTTAPLHSKLEGLELPKKLVDKRLSKQEYAIYLQRLHSLHAKVEPKLQQFAWSEYGITVSNYMRLQLLEKDLQTVGAAREKSSANDFDIASFDEAFGYLYVLTGSTMGGAILSQKVLDLFGEGNQYFNAFGSQTHQRWMQFLAALAKYTQQNGDAAKEGVIQGAIACYELVEEELDAN